MPHGREADILKKDGSREYELVPYLSVITCEIQFRPDYGHWLQYNILILINAENARGCTEV